MLRSRHLEGLSFPQLSVHFHQPPVIIMKALVQETGGGVVRGGLGATKGRQQSQRVTSFDSTNVYLCALSESIMPTHTRTNTNTYKCPLKVTAGKR